jgi:uncharacterized membrane-anchored protein YjiN (DUF445 family)
MDPLGTGDDELRRTELRRMKLVALALLGFAAVVFIVARALEEGNGWAGYVRATAEAGMVGALADWFAVTALFRHPLGLPIPHTAIIQKRKDQIGESLGDFVRDNFLTSEVLAERLADAHLAARMGEWLSHPNNAKTVGDQSAAVVRGVTEVLKDDQVQPGLEHLVVSRVRNIPVTPLAGRAIDMAIHGGHHQALVDSTLLGLSKFLDENQAEFRLRLAEESPWWVPEPIDDRIFEKIYDAVSRFIADVGVDREHVLRKQLDGRTKELAERLKSSDELRDRGEALKEEVLAHPEIRAWSASLWTRIKSGLIEATNDPDSDLRIRLQAAVADAGAQISADPTLAAKLDKWLVEAVGYVAEQFKDEVSGLIATTVQRWDTAETADRLELQVGKDLQFIRINGTIVGGLAGLTIYTLSELVF